MLYACDIVILFIKSNYINNHHIDIVEHVQHIGVSCDQNYVFHMYVIMIHYRISYPENMILEMCLY